MDVENFVKLAMVVSIFVLPALAITTRFALKPIVDAILRLKEGGVLPGASSAGAQEIPLLVAEVRQLRDEVAQLQQSVGQLQEVERFHRSLEAPAPPRALSAPES